MLSLGPQAARSSQMLSPRPSGNDGVLDAGDAAQARRFAAGLDTDLAVNEFQRADSAPRAEGGNGVLSVADVIQANRFILQHDTPATAQGPNSASGFAAASSRICEGRRNKHDLPGAE
jgi:hypothetical protein